MTHSPAAFHETVVDMPAQENNDPPIMHKGRVHFPGQNRIWCAGKLITGHGYWFLFLTLALLLAPLVCVYIFILCEFVLVLPWWPLVILTALSLTSVASACATGWTDPGVLPRNLAPRDLIMVETAVYDPELQTTQVRLVFHEYSPDLLLGKEVSVNGRTSFLKYCHTCQLFRPPRTSHCSYCDNCVEEFDHHCPWVSNCIGRRNYRYFVMFLTSTALYCLCGLVLMAMFVNQWSQRMDTGFVTAAVRDQPGALAIALLGGLMGLALTAMTLYHCVLIGQNRTTAEQVKFSRSNAEIAHPDYPTGCSNFVRVFCAPRYSRHIPWHQYQTTNAPRTNRAS